MTKDSNVPETNVPKDLVTDSAGPDPAAADAPEASQTKRPQRPALLVFTQSVLMLQAFVALFATLVLWSFARNDFISINPWIPLAAGPTLMLLFFYASRQQATRRGRIMGWLLQVPMLAAVFLEPAVAVMGVIFLVLWIMALRIGSRIDRERKERDLAAQAEDPAAETDADSV